MNKKIYKIVISIAIVLSMAGNIHAESTVKSKEKEAVIIYPLGLILSLLNMTYISAEYQRTGFGGSIFAHGGYFNLPTPILSIQSFYIDGGYRWHFLTKNETLTGPYVAAVGGFTYFGVTQNSIWGGTLNASAYGITAGGDIGYEMIFNGLVLNFNTGYEMVLATTATATNSLGAEETLYAGGIGLHWRGLGMGIGYGW